MEKKDMQPILSLAVFSCCVGLIIFDIGLLALGKRPQWVYLAILAVAVVVMISLLPFVKKVWIKVGRTEIGLEKFKDDVDNYAAEKLREIQVDVNLHKESITSILKDVDEASVRLSEHERSIDGLVTNAAKVESDLKKIIEMAKPPILNLSGEKVVNRDDGIAVSFFLTPDKTYYALGEVVVVAQIEKKSSSKILSITPLNAKIFFGHAKPIGEDGKSFYIVFRSPFALPIGVEIIVTELCKLKLSGSYVIDPNVLTLRREISN